MPGVNSGVMVEHCVYARCELWCDADEPNTDEVVWLDRADGIVLWAVPLPDHLGRPGSHQYLLPLLLRHVTHITNLEVLGLDMLTQIMYWQKEDRKCHTVLI